MNILIVDDNQTNRKLLGATLGAEGYRTLEAGDGVEALGVLGMESVDAIISDVLMPNMDGYRLCAEVRRSERHRLIPFIIYTSTYTDRGDEKLALRFGADRYVRKPASSEKISEMVKQLIGERACAPPRPAPAEEMDVMKQYSQALIRKLEKRNDQLLAQTAALHASETRLRTIFEAGPDCVQVVGRGGILMETNAAGLRMFEADYPEQLVNRSIAQFITDEHRDTYKASTEKVWGGVTSSVEFEIVGLQGTRRWLETHATPLRDQDGGITSILAITRDNTARKELETEFVHAQKMDVVGQLAGGVAHDFNNVLGIIIGFSELIMRDIGSGSPLHKSVLTISHAAERAAALTRQLLIFSRKEMPQPEVLDLSELITGMDSMLRRLIGENVRLITKPDLALGRIEADPGQIEQILMNLIVNARDAMPGGGTITISTTNVTVSADEVGGADVAPGGYVVLTVADDGCGMSAAVKAKMFEAFFTTKPAGQGTGLGLATCQRIATRWHGYITANSQLGVGTEFKIYLPRIIGVLPFPMAASQVDSLPRGTETILIVEDEPGLRELAATILETQGYAVLKAGNGQEALRIVREPRAKPIDLILSDMVMPEMSGPIMSEWLQATNPEIKVLFTSGYSDCGTDGFLDSKVEFLAKPYTPSALVRKTRQVIDHASNKAALPAASAQ